MNTQDKRNPALNFWPALLLITGGLLMAGLWVNYTFVHGPTSYDEQGIVLGQSTLFWGSMLSGPPTLLIVLGLLLLRPTLLQGAGRLARIGFIFTAAGMLVPAVIDLIFVFIGPPLLLPLVGAGLLMVAQGLPRAAALTRAMRPLLLGMGSLLLLSILWSLLPLPLFDRLYGYRVYGFATHLLFGAGWVAIGVRLLRAGKSEHLSVLTNPAGAKH